MQFTNPFALSVLGLIPVLILIHMITSRPRQAEVTNIFLWQEALREKKGGIRLQRFLRNLPLWFQILIVFLTSAALAEPIWFYPSKVTGNIILVLDTSASMKTLTPEKTRFEQAQKEAIGLIEELPERSKMLIMTAGNRPELLTTGFTSDKSTLKRLVKDVRPLDVPGELEKALYLALSFVNPEQDDWIFLITDGAGGEFARLSKIHPKIRPILISGGGNNVGITKFTIKSYPGLSERYEIMLEVKNFTSNSVKCPIRLTLKRKTIIAESLTLTPFEKQLLVFPYSGPFTGTVRVFLELEDDFPLDNQVFSEVSASQDIWVMLVTKGNYFLEKLLTAYPNLLVNVFDEVTPSSWDIQTQQHDIVILDRIPPPATERGNFLLIDAFSPSIPITKIGQVEAPHVLDWDQTHPLMSQLDLTGLQIAAAEKTEAGASVQQILEANQTGLIYAYQQDNLRTVFIGFDLLRSDLPLRVAFPVLIGNILRWLRPAKLQFTAFQAKAGQPLEFFLAPGTDRLSLRKPSGKWNRSFSATNPFKFDETNEVGLYTLVEGKKRRYFAVNLLNESESDIRSPEVETAVEETTIIPTSKLVTAKISLWLPIMLLALAALLVEWYVWLKNK